MGAVWAILAVLDQRDRDGPLRSKPAVGVCDRQGVPDEDRDHIFTQQVTPARSSGTVVGQGVSVMSSTK